MSQGNITFVEIRIDKNHGNDPGVHFKLEYTGSTITNSNLCIFMSIMFLNAVSGIWQVSFEYNFIEFL